MTDNNHELQRRENDRQAQVPFGSNKGTLKSPSEPTMMMDFNNPANFQSMSGNPSHPLLNNRNVNNQFSSMDPKHSPVTSENNKAQQRMADNPELTPGLTAQAKKQAQQQASLAAAPTLTAGCSK